MLFPWHCVFYLLLVQPSINASLKHVTLLALEKTVNYIQDYTHGINPDCVLGLHVTKLLLESSLSLDTIKNDSKIVESVIKKINIIESFNLPKFNHQKRWLLEKLMSSDLWPSNLTFNKKLKCQNSPMDTNDLSYEDYYKWSEQCLIQSLLGKKRDLGLTYCELEPICYELFLNPNSTGVEYQTTHKLLFLHVGKHYCKQLYIESVSQIDTLCCKIYWDMSTEFNKEFINLDLFLEQLTLCSLQGYEEFINLNWLNRILDAQQPSGCFKAFGGRHTWKRPKRDYNFFPDGCVDHTTGLGACVLSVYLRYF